MAKIRGASAENGWPHTESVVYQAIGVLMVRNQTTVEQAADSLDEMARAAGLDLTAVAAQVVRSTRTEDGGKA